MRTAIICLLILSSSLSFELFGQSIPTADFVRLRNRWKTDHYVHIEKGPVEAGQVLGGYWSAMWSLQPVGDGVHFRIRNRWKPDVVLHLEHPQLEAGPIHAGAWSAMWVLERVGDGLHFRLRNRWKSNQYLHLESGKLQAGPIQGGWYSAMWSFQPLNAWPGDPAPPKTDLAAEQAKLEEELRRLDQGQQNPTQEQLAKVQEELRIAQILNPMAQAIAQGGALYRYPGWMRFIEDEHRAGRLTNELRAAYMFQLGKMVINYFAATPNYSVSALENWTRWVSVEDERRRIVQRAINEGKPTESIPLFLQQDLNRVSPSYATVSRLKENIEIQRENSSIEQENKEIERMQLEAKKLEEELKALERGGN